MVRWVALVLALLACSAGAQAQQQKAVIDPASGELLAAPAATEKSDQLATELPSPEVIVSNNGRRGLRLGKAYFQTLRASASDAGEFHTHCRMGH